MIDALRSGYFCCIEGRFVSLFVVVLGTRCTIRGAPVRQDGERACRATDRDARHTGNEECGAHNGAQHAGGRVWYLLRGEYRSYCKLLLTQEAGFHQVSGFRHHNHIEHLFFFIPLI